MNFEESLAYLKIKVKEMSVIRDGICVSAIMREFSKLFKEDQDKWAICGLLYPISKLTLQTNADVMDEIITDMEVDPSIVYSIRSQYHENGLHKKRKMDKLLPLASTLKDVIFTLSKQLPEKQDQELTVEYILKNIKNSDWISIEQQNILFSSALEGIETEEFVTLALGAMQGISDSFEF